MLFRSRVTEDEKAECHQPLNRHDFEQAPGDGEGQGSLECCNPLGCKESDMAEQQNNINITQEQSDGND